LTQGTLIDVPAHCGVDDDNQRFTTREALAWVKAVAGVEAFDLDVAACPESHHAPVWYGRQVDGSWVDGLKAPWFGRVFLQPPWDDLYPWIQTAWAQWTFTTHSPSVIAALLPGNRTHRPWWQELVEPHRDIGGLLKAHFAPKRFAYGGPGNPLGIDVPEPNFTSVALVWRRA
jgi:hypothetical protein